MITSSSSKPHGEPWIGVELRHLAALDAVARTGSFHGAADELDYVQSAISHQIASLEDLVGVRLLNRAPGSRRVSVTSAGRMLMTHADRIMAEFRAARADLEAMHAGSATVRLGVPQGLAVGLLPSLLRRLEARAPGLRVDATECDVQGPLFELLERGELDVVLGTFPIPEGPFLSQELVSDPAVLIARSGTPLADVRRTIGLDDLAQTPLIIHEGFPEIEAQLRSQGLEPNVAFRTPLSATVEAMVAAGIGIAIIPSLAALPGTSGTVRVGVEGLVPPRLAGVCWHADRHALPALERFTEVLLDGWTTPELALSAA